jgi:hypothetical protein
MSPKLLTVIAALLVAASTALAAPAPDPKTIALQPADVRGLQPGLKWGGGPIRPGDEYRPRGWIEGWRGYGTVPNPKAKLAELNSYADVYKTSAAAGEWVKYRKREFVQSPNGWHPLGTAVKIGDATETFTTTLHPGGGLHLTYIAILWRYKTATALVTATGNAKSLKPDPIVRLARRQQTRMKAALG